MIQLRETDILQKLLSSTELVTLRRSGNQPPVSLDLFKNTLNQRYLVGQNLVYDHKNYQIMRIDRENGVIVSDEANPAHNNPCDYIQVRHYLPERTDAFYQGCNAVTEGGTIEQATQVTGSHLFYSGDHVVTGLSMVRSFNALDITSDTIAYYPIQDTDMPLNLRSSTVQSRRLNEGERNILKRKVGQALYVNITGDFNRSDKLTMTLAVLLQEMMKTLFPDHYFCIAVCPILEDPDFIYQNPELISRQIADMYPRLLEWKQPLPNSIELLIVDDCVDGSGVLDILYAPEGMYFTNILDMLYDYLKWQEDQSDAPYIYFGNETCPAIYDISGLTEILRVFAKTYTREHDLLSKHSQSHRCSFCGNDLRMGSYLWNNRLNICEECHNELRPAADQHQQILDHICRFYSEQFGAVISGVTTAPYDGEELSVLDVDAKEICISADLPLTQVHCELAGQLVRLWQLEHLKMSGDPLLEGQVLYVKLQYLEYLKQHQHKKRLHRLALLSSDPISVGYCSLRNELQAVGSDNSFQYMLSHFKKGTQPPIRKDTPRRSTRKITGDKNTTEYYSTQLDEARKNAYKDIYDCIMSMSESVDLEKHGLKEDTIFDLWHAIMWDHPDISWVRTYSFYTDPATSAVTKLVPNYVMSREEINRQQAEVDAVVTEYISDITPDTDDYNAALKIYKRIAESLDYDSIALERQQRRRSRLKAEGKQDDLPDELRSVHGALVQKKTVCAGYAKAFQTLAQRVGLDCLYVCGDCHDGERHAWNIVKLEGNYYHVDATWGDRSNTDASKNNKGMSYSYFGLTDTDIRKSRSIDPRFPTPPCNSTDCNYHVRNRLMFDYYDHAAIKARILELFEEDPGRKSITLRFATKQVFSTALRYLTKNGGMYEILRAANYNGQYYYYTNDTLFIIDIELNDKE